MRTPRHWTAALAALLLLVAPTPAAADIAPPPGVRRQPHEFHIDLGPYGDVRPRQHVVAKGDTLGALAKRYLGTTTRWQEIRRANPTVDPEKLLVGSTLQIPARRAALDPAKPETADGPRHRWDFYTYTAGWSAIDPLDATGALKCLYHMGTALIAVRHDHDKTFRKLAKNRDWRAATFGRSRGKDAPAWTAVGPTAFFREVKDADPVFLVRDSVRILAIRDGRIHTERVRLDKLDAHGEALTPSEIVARRSKGAIVFVLLGLVGLVLLVHVTMRRRRAHGARALATPTVTTAALIALLLGSAAPAAADLPVPGRKNVTTEVTLDFGPYADFTTQVHVLQKGETVATIDPPSIGPGMSRHAPALLASLDLKKLKPGDRVSYPPRRLPLSASKAEDDPQPLDPRGPRKHWWHVYSVPSPSMKLIPFGHGEAVPVQHYGTQVIAVRHDNRKAFDAAFADPKTGGYRYLRRLADQKPAWFATTNKIDAGRTSIKSGSPVHRIVKAMRITSLGDGVMGVETVATRWFGKNGKELSEKEVKAAGGMPFVFGALAAAALLVLVVLGVRRRRIEVAPTA